MEDLTMETSPSAIAEAFDYDCERHLVYRSLDDRIKEQLGIKKSRYQTYLSRSGKDLEYEILTNSRYGIIGKYQPQIPNDKTSIEPVPYYKTIEYLRNPPADYLYQLTLLPTADFKKKYKFPNNFDFKKSFPDLVKVEWVNEKPAFTVIDIKLARKIKMKQKMQVTLYALLLDSVLKENNIEGNVNLKEGLIWNNGNDTPTTFNMEEVIPFVEAFFENIIPNTAGKLSKLENLNELEEILNHKMSYHCEWCSAFDYCFNRACEKNDIKALPYLSKYAQTHVDDLNDKSGLIGTGSDISINILKQYIEKNGKEELELCQSWKKHLGRFDRNTLYIDKELEILQLIQEANVSLLTKVIQKVVDNKLDDSSDLFKNLENSLNKLVGVKREDSEYIGSKINHPNNQSNSWVMKRLQDKKQEVDNVIAYAENALSALRNSDLVTLKSELEKLQELNLAVQKFYVQNKSSMSMPIHEDIKIILTAQADEATDRMFGLGISYNISGKKQNLIELPINSEEYNKTAFAFVAKTKNDFDSIEDNFVDKLYELLKNIDDYNASKYDRNAEQAVLSDEYREVQRNNWKEQLSVQTYVMDNYEWDNLKSVFFNMIKQGRKVEEVLKILFYLHGDQLVTDSDVHPDEITNVFPVISITQVVRQLFILPAYISYGMDDIANIFETRPYKKIIPQYANLITNVLPSEVINRSWDRRKKNEIDEAYEDYNKVTNQIYDRLKHESNILIGIRQEIKINENITGQPILVAWAEKFRFPEEAYFKSNILSKLYFETKYEEMLKYLEVRAPRMESIEEAVEQGTILSATFLDEETIIDNDGDKCRSFIFKVNNPTYNNTTEFKFDSLICEASQESVKQIRAYNDFNSAYMPKGSNLKLLRFWKGEFSTGSSGTMLRIWRKKTDWDTKKINFDRECRYFIFEQYVDWNSAKVVGGMPTPLSNPKKTQQIPGILKKIEDDKNYFITFLEDPCNKFAQSVSAPIEENMLKTLEDNFEYPFTSSQKKAFKHFFENNLTLVLGPPGTGKTDFIAKSLIMLIKYNTEQFGKPLKILISGMSHAAIENVLLTINEYIIKLHISNIRLCKVKEMKTKGYDHMVIKEENIRTDGYIEKLPKESVITASTLWGIGKAYIKGILGQNDTFDIVVIDEASQVRTMDSLLAVTAAAERGRLLIVGDDNQLPPIIQGTYELSEQEVDCYGSIFRLLYDYDGGYKKDKGGYRYTVQLNEQFRMNDILSLYPSQKIYGKEYKAGNTKVANQKLSFLNHNIDTSAEYALLSEYIMDPDYPFVVCSISGGESTEQRDCEVNAVVKVAQWCREYLYDENEQKYQEEIDFWHKGMFVISPHHEQINLIKQKLGTITVGSVSLNTDAFVDTVDKMQGQQADVAIVSYGVTDIEKALLEKEFIFSRNRLNVSITRGKKKTILFLSDVLTKKNLDMLDETDDEILKGVEFMNSIEVFAKTPDDNPKTECIDKEFNFNNVKVRVYKKRMK